MLERLKKLAFIGAALSAVAKNPTVRKIGFGAGVGLTGVEAVGTYKENKSGFNQAATPPIPSGDR